MALAPAIRAAIAVLRSRTDDVLPAFLLTPAVAAVARTVGLVGVALAYAHLELTGGLEQFRSDLADRQLDPPDPNAEPEAFAEWVDGIAPLFESLLTPTTVGILVVSGVLALAVFVALSAVATAAQFAACRATLDDERGTTAAIRGARRHWLPMLGVLIAEFLLWGLLTGIAIAIVAAVALVSPIAAALVGLLVVLLWFFAVVAVRLVFAFAPAAVVVDDAGFAGAVGNGARFVRRAPVDAVSYSLLAVVVFGALGSLTAFSAQAGGVVVGVLSFLLVAPALSLTKTALYARHVDGIAPPPTPDRSLTDQLGDGLRRGLGEMVRFVGDSPGANLLSAALFVGGIAIGWLLAAPYEGLMSASIAGRLEGHFPPTAALFFGANNWTVAVGGALSGLALAVPTAVTMLFNGAMFGVYGRLEVDLLELVAFVVPHGILELPALVVSGGLGLALGATAWRTLRGRWSISRLAADIERAFWVLVGVGVLLGVAALIEGFVSPYYSRIFLAVV
ncbi:stage II sporulation protein M [Natronomonas salina]|uniref:stage II sporulation protein M n=1 Tax=Natronomonas salina TaxID=1710540 RepID=UPI0015B3F980|nr:stage II sporulation protein M [Natronomonas salina]QLD87616.1 stage II sporulation protein M [Natronomonas salina]